MTSNTTRDQINREQIQAILEILRTEGIAAEHVEQIEHARERGEATEVAREKREGRGPPDLRAKREGRGPPDLRAKREGRGPNDGGGK